MCFATRVSIRYAIPPLCAVSLSFLLEYSIPYVRTDERATVTSSIRRRLDSICRRPHVPRQSPEVYLEFHIIKFGGPHGLEIAHSACYHAIALKGRDPFTTGSYGG